MDSPPDEDNLELTDAQMLRITQNMEKAKRARFDREVSKASTKSSQKGGFFPVPEIPQSNSRKYSTDPDGSVH